MEAQWMMLIELQESLEKRYGSRILHRSFERSAKSHESAYGPFAWIEPPLNCAFLSMGTCQSLAHTTNSIKGLRKDRAINHLISRVLMSYGLLEA